MEFILGITSALYAENESVSVVGSWPELGCFDRNEMETYFRDLTKGIVVDPSIDDWILRITIYLGGRMHEKEIAIYRRGFTYVSDKEKEISIRISLPSSDEIS